MKLRILNLQLVYNWLCSIEYKINFKNLLFLLKIDLVHEFIHYTTSSLTKRLKHILMKIFYHTKDYIENLIRFIAKLYSIFLKIISGGY